MKHKLKKVDMLTDKRCVTLLCLRAADSSLAALTAVVDILGTSFTIHLAWDTLSSSS